MHPGWLCPSCGQGFLIAKQSLLKVPTAGSRDETALNLAWHPLEVVENRFARAYICNNKSCRESAIAVGVHKYIRVDNCGCDICQERGEHYSEILKITWVDPSPDLIRIYAACPPSVADILRRVFCDAWSSPAAALNGVRVALEAMAEAEGISPKNSDGGFKSTHKRIEELCDYLRLEPEVKNRLLAIKWLGNAGSHHGVAEQVDVFDALDILELVFEELHNKHVARVNSRVKEVLHAKGPR